MKNRNSLISVTVVVVVAKLVAFLKSFVLSYFYGVSAVSDAYNVAYTIPITAISFVAIALNTSYIPVYNKAEQERGESAAKEFSTSLLSLIFWISAITFVLIELFATPIVKIFAHGFAAETLELSVQLTRWMAVSVFFIGYNHILSAYVQLKNRYYVVVYCNLVLYLMSILGIVFAFYFQIEMLSIGVVAGYAIESMVLTVTAARQNYRIKLKIKIQNKYLQDLIVMVIPVMIGSLAHDISMIVDKTIASTFQEGSLSILNYAHQLVEAIISIFISSLVAVSYPRLAAAAKQDINALRKQIKVDTTLVMALTIPIMAGILVFSEDIISLLFVRGAFTEEDGVAVARLFCLYAIGLLPTAIRKYFVRIYYSFEDTKFPASNSLIVIGINITASMILSRLIGLDGIALGTTVAISVGAIRLVLCVKKYVEIPFADMIKPFCKVLLATGLSIFSSKAAQLVLREIINRHVLLILCIVIAIGVYLIMLLVLKMQYLFKRFKQ